MSQQLDLLDSGAPRFPRARRSDPKSSHQAAAAGEKSGGLSAQLELVRTAVNRWAGYTSRELASLMQDHGISFQRAFDRYVIARRLPELERLGHVRKGAIRDCTAGGRPSVTWWPA